MKSRFLPRSKWSCTICSLLLTSVVNASGMIYTGNGFNDGNNGLTFGVQFTPSVNLTVTALGVLDAGSDGPGLQSSHSVGVYNNTCPAPCSPLVTATVTASDTLQNGFRFASISPLVLTAGQSYIVAAYYPSGVAGDKLTSTVLNTHPLISVASGTRYAGGAALTYPSSSNPDFRLCANMLFTASTSVIGNGDLNGDTHVDAADVALATRIVTGLLTPSTNQRIAGDVAPYSGTEIQPDNKIDAGDLLLIIRVAAGALVL